MKKRVFFIITVSLAVVLWSIIAGRAEEKNKITKEIIIKVQHKIIALPDNPAIVKVPLSAARVRSTDLRNLNKKYNAVSIEKVFEVRGKPRAKAKELKDSLVSREKPAATDKKLDLSKIFTAQAKSELEASGKVKAEGVEMLPAEDVFLIQFEFDKEVNMNQLISEYRQLPVVIDCQYVTRKGR